MATIFQTTRLDEVVAEELMGWRWMAYEAIPVRGTPGYPTKCRVRRFFPPAADLHESWNDFFASNECVPATGDEPLDYSYCSSNGPHMVPHFSGDANACRQMELEINRRGLWDSYQDALANQVEEDVPLALAECEPRCVAALVAIGSKRITIENDAG